MIKGRAGTVHFEDKNRLANISLDGDLFCSQGNDTFFLFLFLCVLPEVDKKSKLCLFKQLGAQHGGESVIFVISFPPHLIPPRNGGAFALTSDG